MVKMVVALTTIVNANKRRNTMPGHYGKKMKKPIYRFSLRDEQRMNHSFEIYSNSELRSASGRLCGSSSSDDYQSVANHLARVCPAQHLWEMRKLGLTDLVAEVRQRKIDLGLLPKTSFSMERTNGQRSFSNGIGG